MRDFRAYLKPMPGSDSNDAKYRLLGDVSDPGNIMKPLHQTGGLLFPYTPTLTQVGGVANYDEFHATHSNYAQPIYKNSKPNNIVMTAVFTAQTEEEAKYVLAALRFCSSATKMNFGERDRTVSEFGTVVNAGTPPPIMIFNYMGSHVFNKVPVVMGSFNYELTNDVDYVPVKVPGNGGDNVSHVPTELTMIIELIPYFNPRTVRKDFLLSDFTQGKFLNGGRNGWL